MENIQLIIDEATPQRLDLIIEFFKDRGKTAYTNEQSQICREIVFYVESKLKGE